jgi:hypothetical protein
MCNPGKAFVTIKLATPAQWTTLVIIASLWGLNLIGAVYLCCAKRAVAAKRNGPDSATEQVSTSGRGQERVEAETLVEEFS